MRLVRTFCLRPQVCTDSPVAGKLKTVISGHMGWVRSVAVEPGNQWFATGAGDRVIKVRPRLRAIRRNADNVTCLDLGFGVGRVEALANGSYIGGSRVGRIDETSVSVLMRGRQGVFIPAPFPHIADWCW